MEILLLVGEAGGLARFFYFGQFASCVGFIQIFSKKNAAQVGWRIYRCSYYNQAIPSPRCFLAARAMHAGVDLE